jgi:hypothetical protein
MPCVLAGLVHDLQAAGMGTLLCSHASWHQRCGTQRDCTVHYTQLRGAGSQVPALLPACVAAGPPPACAAWRPARGWRWCALALMRRCCQACCLQRRRCHCWTPATAGLRAALGRCLLLALQLGPQLPRHSARTCAFMTSSLRTNTSFCAEVTSSWPAGHEVYFVAQNILYREPATAGKRTPGLTAAPLSAA